MKCMMSILAAALMTTWAGVAAQSDSSMSQKNEMTMDTMKKDNMMSTMLTLSSTAVDLSKHVGQKVSVTGSLGPQTASMDKGAMAKEPTSFTVKSLKTVSRSCS